MSNSIDKQNVITQCLDGTDFGLLIVDDSYKMIWCNKAAARAVHQEANLTVADSWSDLLHLNASELYIKLKEAELSNKDDIHYVVPNTEKQYRIKLFPAKDGTALVLTELTEQPASKHFLIDERNIDILINITEHPIWLVDVQCRLTLFNKAFSNWISGFTGTVLGLGDCVLDEQLDNSYLTKFRMCYELALTGKSFTTVEDVKVDGMLKFTTVNFNPVKDGNNNITGVSCYATDITDHRQTLTRIEAQTQLLMEIANIQSHKVRGPVATLLGLVSVFNADDYTDPNNAEVIEGIAVVAEKLDSIVTEVIRSINRLSPRK